MDYATRPLPKQGLTFSDRIRNPSSLGPIVVHIKVNMRVTFAFEMEGKKGHG